MRDGTLLRNRLEQRVIQHVEGTRPELKLTKSALEARSARTHALADADRCTTVRSTRRAPRRRNVRNACPPPLDPERTLSRLEQLLVGIFQAEGPVLGFTRAIRLAEAGGMNPASAGVYLSRSPVFQTVARGRYTIRGSGGDVVSMRATVRNELSPEALVA